MLLEVDRSTGRLLRVLETYQELNDPGMPIPAQATAIHGITNAMVKGRRIDAARVTRLLLEADLVVAHNSGFDKGFVRQVVPGADALAWACSCRGIPFIVDQGRAASGGGSRICGPAANDGGS